jgi:HEPN domain-containing protein
MDKEAIIDYWISEAEESLRVAQHLFDKNDYSYALFFGHLAIEKLLKAAYVQKIDVNVPRTHNLPRIAKAAGLVVPGDMLTDMIRITVFNLEARYPDYRRKFRKKCTQHFTSKELEKIHEVFKWLKSAMKH